MGGGKGCSGVVGDPPAKRETLNSRRCNLRNGNATNNAALKGPTLRGRGQPRQGWVANRAIHPQVETCGYARLAPFGAYRIAFG